MKQLEDERRRLINENRRLKAMVEPKMESIDDASEQCDDVILVENDQSDAAMIDQSDSNMINQKTFDFSVSNLSKSEQRIQPRQIKPIGIEHHFPIQPAVQSVQAVQQSPFKQPLPVQPTQNIVHQSYASYQTTSQPTYSQPTYHHQHAYANQNSSFMDMMTQPMENPHRNPMMLPDQGSDFDSFLNNLMQL